MRAPEGGGQIADDTAETAIRGGRGSGKARRDPGGEEAFFPGLLMTKAGKEKRRRKEAAWESQSATGRTGRLNAQNPPQTGDRQRKESSEGRPADQMMFC